MARAAQLYGFPILLLVSLLLVAGFASAAIPEPLKNPFPEPPKGLPPSDVYRPHRGAKIKTKLCMRCRQSQSPGAVAKELENKQQAALAKAIPEAEELQEVAAEEEKDRQKAAAAVGDAFFHADPFDALQVVKDAALEACLFLPAEERKKCASKVNAFPSTANSIPDPAAFKGMPPFDGQPGSLPIPTLDLKNPPALDGVEIAGTDWRKMEPDPNKPSAPYTSPDDPATKPNENTVKAISAPYTTFVELDSALKGREGKGGSGKRIAAAAGGMTPQKREGQGDSPADATAETDLAPFTTDEEDEEDPDLHSRAEWQSVMGKWRRQKKRQEARKRAKEEMEASAGDALILAELPICVNEGSRRLIYSLFRAVVGQVGDIHCEEE